MEDGNGISAEGSNQRIRELNHVAGVQFHRMACDKNTRMHFSETVFHSIIILGQAAFILLRALSAIVCCFEGVRGIP